MRLPEPGVVAPDLPARGERAPDADTLFWSIERVLLSAELFVGWSRSGVGCDNVFILAARDAVIFREVSAW